MKSVHWVISIVGVLFLMLGSAWAGTSARGLDAPSQSRAAVVDIGTAFTFQGQLTFNGRSVNDQCLMRFSLFNAATGGAQVGSTFIPLAAVPVVNGLFAIELDFEDVFDNTALWLENEVKCTSDGDYVNLGRQRITATPQAGNARRLNGVPGSLYERAYLEGTITLIQGTSVIIEIPNWYPFTLQLGSGWPGEGGVAFVTGMENDRVIAITYIAYNGDGTSQSGGAECVESTTTTLLTFGNGNYTYQVKCPGEASGAHNLVLSANALGVELRYKLIY